MILLTVTIPSDAQSFIKQENIKETIYSEENYSRTSLFKEQDLIYGKTTVFHPGLELICLQDKVEVEIGGYETMYTPVDINNMPAGDYSVKLRKTGFLTSQFRISISSSKRTSIIVNMLPYTTTLTLKDLPENSIIFINNKKIEGHSAEVPRGDNYLRISAFGYENYSQILKINSAEEVILKPELIKKEFGISEIDISRPVVWNNDSKSQKFCEISIFANAPGTGNISIIRLSDGKTLVSEDLIYDKIKTNYIFDLNAFPEKREESFSIIVKGESDGIEDTQQATLELKNGIKSLWRNTMTGLSGLIFVPTAETLPAGVSQFQTSISPVFNLESIDDFYIPALMSLRVSLLQNLEITFGAGLFLSPEMNESSIDVFASGKMNVFKTDGSDGFSLSTGISLNYNGKTSAYEYVPDYDPFAGLTGLSFAFPLQYRLGIFLAVFTPEIKISPSYPGLDNGGFSGDSLYVWNYLRWGIALDFGEVSGAISMALQTPSYGNGLDQWPLFMGLEISTTPGNSGFSGSIYTGVRYIKDEDLQIGSGISAGFIF
jgi:hypothetical protein